MAEGGQIGLDEGAIAEALSKPLWRQVTRTMEYDKHNNMISEVTESIDVSLLTVLTPIVIAAGAYYGYYQSLAEQGKAPPLPPISSVGGVAGAADPWGAFGVLGRLLEYIWKKKG